jgi:polygalacturonase
MKVGAEEKPIFLDEIESFSSAEGCTVFLSAGWFVCYLPLPTEVV